MDKKTAHEIAKKAAIAAYKVTLEKLAQNVDLMGAMKDSFEKERLPSPKKPAKLAPEGAPRTEVTVPEGGRERYVPEDKPSPGKANRPWDKIKDPQTGEVTQDKVVDFSKGASKNHKEIMRVAAKFEKTLKKYSK